MIDLAEMSGESADRAESAAPTTVLIVDDHLSFAELLAAALDAPIPLLTPREMEGLTYLGPGMPVPRIARSLGISLHTCRGYVKSLDAKLGVSTQLKAVIKAQQLGLFHQVR